MKEKQRGYATQYIFFVLGCLIYGIEALPMLLIIPPARCNYNN